MPKPKVVRSIEEFRRIYFTPELCRALEEFSKPTKTIVIIPRKR